MDREKAGLEALWATLVVILVVLFIMWVITRIA
jgi:hypothetical protein